MTFAIDAHSHATAWADITNWHSTGVSWSHTLASNVNKIVVQIACGASVSFNNRDVQSVSVGGQAATKIVDQDDANFCNVELWQLNNPPTGTQTITVIGVADAAVCRGGAGATSFIGASPNVRSTGGVSASNANPSVTVATLSGDICIGVLNTDLGSGGSTTPNGTQIWEDEDVSTDIDVGAQYVSATGISAALSWVSAANAWSACACVIIPMEAVQTDFVGSFGRRRSRYAI
jgi:hypothetical protein